MLNYYIDLSERIFEKANSGEDSSMLRQELYHIRINSFESKINTDELKRLFWINIYNSYLNILISEGTKKGIIFKKKRIKFSNYLLSLNDVEYGILKTQKYNLGFYKIVNPFYPNFIKRLAIKDSDESIIDSLNKNILKKKVEL